MSTFIEATVRYRSFDADPRAPADQEEKRLFNLDDVVLIFPKNDDGTLTVLQMRLGSVGGSGWFVVAEPYEYFAAALTAWQPRAMEQYTSNGGSRV